MRKITLLGLALALTLVALPGLAADAPDTAVETVTLDQLFTAEVQPESAESEAAEAEVVLDGSEPLFLAGGGGDCGGVTCGKGEYCCNASCAWCRPHGMSCIQISCN